MSWFFSPDDWLARHPRVCMILLVALIALVGAIE